MNEKLAELFEYWDSDEGKPYKGQLIDYDTYTTGGIWGEDGKKGSIGCMCAQGQVLHVVGGWSAAKLNDVFQDEADRAVTKLLNISKSHAILLREINDQVNGAPGIVLNDPFQVLGENWSKVLDFWWYLDKMLSRQQKSVSTKFCKISRKWQEASYVNGAYVDGPYNIVRNRTYSNVFAKNTFFATVRAGMDNEISEGAAVEICAGDLPLNYLPIFGFDSIDDIPPRPENYGQGKKG